MGTIARAVLGYCVLLLTVRVLSRRPGGQFTLFEFVIIFLIGGVAIAATVGRDHSVTNCGMAILAIGFMHRLVAYLKGRSPRFGAFIDGTPLVLVRNGEWQLETMNGMKVDPEDVMAAARLKMVHSIFDVKYAVLERKWHDQHHQTGIVVTSPCCTLPGTHKVSHVLRTFSYGVVVGPEDYEPFNLFDLGSSR